METIRDDLIRLHHDRDIWMQMRDALLASPGEPIFLAHYARIYGEGQALGIRRQVEVRTDSISLMRLLTEIAGRPDVPTRERYLGIFARARDGVMAADPPSGFTGLVDIFGVNEAYYDREWGDGRGNLNVQRVRDDQELLKKTADIVRRWANKTIAHIDAQGFNDDIRWGHLDEALSLLGDMFLRYDRLVRAATYGDGPDALVPGTGDWQEAFRHPLHFKER
jgi:hypothetical protein